MKKILTVNLIIIITIFAVLEFISYLYLKKDSESYMKPYNEYAKSTGLPLLTQRYGKIKVFEQDKHTGYRPVTKGEKDKPSAIFFGCSYTEGEFFIKDNETLPAIFGEKTGMTVINRGIKGGGILNTLHDLNDDKFYEEISKYPEPKYIFYVWINDQFNRIYNPFIGTVMHENKPVYEVRVLYKEKDGKYIEDKPGFLKRFLYHFYTTKAFYYLFSQTTAKDTQEERMLKYLKEVRRITEERFPGSKFIVIQYKDGGHCMMPEELKTDLKEAGIKVLDSEELAGHELESEAWRGGDKEHPNARAYEDVATGLVKELNL